MQSTIAFGYVCQECGEGTVLEQVFPEYCTKIKGYPYGGERCPDWCMRSV